MLRTTSHKLPPNSWSSGREERKKGFSCAVFSGVSFPAWNDNRSKRARFWNGIFGLWRNNMSFFSRIKRVSRGVSGIILLLGSRTWMSYGAKLRPPPGRKVLWAWKFYHTILITHTSPWIMIIMAAFFTTHDRIWWGFGWLLQLDELWPKLAYLLRYYEYFDAKKQFPCVDEFILLNKNFSKFHWKNNAESFRNFFYQFHYIFKVYVIKIIFRKIVYFVQFGNIDNFFLRTTKHNTNKTHHFHVLTLTPICLFRLVQTCPN